MSIPFRGLLWIGLGAILLFIGYNLYQISSRLPERSYSAFLDDLTGGDIVQVIIKDGLITGTDNEDRRFTTYAPDLSSLLPLLRRHEVEIITKPSSQSSGFIRDLLLVLLILGGWMIFGTRKSRQSLQFARTKTYQRNRHNLPRVSFEDVAGIAEAREELQEITAFLKDPAKFGALGGRIPKGVLLQGPPGTGKTMLAKAIAGEASVPFYSLGGSDFVEMFAGLGASRVRDLFGEAKKHAPCIIFIDEIDAIGGKRAAQYRSGSNDEREQTLNALLVEMDGFTSHETVIVVAATNRPDILDSALLRPGRFDRRISLTLPDIRGRQKILEVHSRHVAIGSSVDFSVIAKGTPGFSGAELANLVNEAALLAARKGKTMVDLADFEEAKDKIIMGLERKNVVISEKARRLTAYHEAGHAVLAIMLPETDPLHKITIIPRGQALGLTQQLPFDEQFTYSRTYLVNRIKILLGGRLAEELVFGQLSTGASNDLQTVSRIAYRLVCHFGMSSQIGPLACSDATDQPDGDGFTWRRSEQTRREVDMEIRTIIQTCYQEAKDLLEKNSTFLHMLAEALLVQETLDHEEVDIIHRCYLNHHREEQKKWAIVPTSKRSRP
ncbi:MAG: ATP-dependent zinc metalloprotease FtsH [Desulfofustis sp.]|jgi:cell division protease FtsH|nr:ATP-dependent zinc metalloprotease FtsH [Desulfofustis sp.]